MLTATSACSRASGDKDYFPLASGAIWEYTGTFSSATGERYPVRGTVHNDGDTLIHGKQYFKMVITTDLSGVPKAPSKQHEEVRYYRAAQDGIYFLLGRETDRPELLEMPLPIPIGVKWLSGATEVRAERAGTIKAGDREYSDCLKITFQYSDGARTMENYLAPGVGIIKTVYVNTTEPKSTIELILEKYKL